LRALSFVIINDDLNELSADMQKIGCL